MKKGKGCVEEMPEETMAELRKRYNRVKYKNRGKGFDTFEKFSAWALEQGYRVGMDIQRKDLKGPWEPENCFITFQGEGKWRREAIPKWNRTVNRLRRYYGLEPFPESQYQAQEKEAPGQTAPGTEGEL